jgi:hypothetical protein
VTYLISTKPERVVDAGTGPKSSGGVIDQHEMKARVTPYCVILHICLGCGVACVSSPLSLEFYFGRAGLDVSRA